MHVNIVIKGKVKVSNNFQKLGLSFYFILNFFTENYLKSHNPNICDPCKSTFWAVAWLLSMELPFGLL